MDIFPFIQYLVELATVVGGFGLDIFDKGKRILDILAYSRYYLFRIELILTFQHRVKIYFKAFEVDVHANMISIKIRITNRLPISAMLQNLIEFYGSIAIRV